MKIFYILIFRQQHKKETVKNDCFFTVLVSINGVFSVIAYIAGGDGVDDIVFIEEKPQRHIGMVFAGGEIAPGRAIVLVKASVRLAVSVEHIVFRHADSYAEIGGDIVLSAQDGADAVGFVVAAVDVVDDEVAVIAGFVDGVAVAALHDQRVLRPLVDVVGGIYLLIRREAADV